MSITQLPGTHRRGAGIPCTDSHRHESVLFTSTCPRCTRDQPQRGFSRAALERLFRRGYPVEAYCVMCDQFWAISVRERVALARLLSQPAD
jgi:hypothetical protein